MIPLSAREVESVLKRHGFECMRASGSHFQWVNRATRKLVTIPHHGNSKLQQGTLKSIVKQSGLDEMMFRKKI